MKPFCITADSPEQLVSTLRSIADGGRFVSEPPTTQRLIVVADSAERLAELCSRAADRLQRRADKPIHDVSGIYYYPEPLGLTGSVAWVFPGEGAQYLGMLQGLETQWPEVESVLSACDGFARQIGGEFRGLRYFVDGWQHEADREQAEARLRRLDNAMLSVLSAGWCLSEVAAHLDIPMHAVAGHSAGELAALMTAGSMKVTTELPMFAAVMNEMEVQSGGGDAQLLAVAAPADKVSRAVSDALLPVGLNDQAMVAMDNCPHQSIVVGRREAIKIVNTALQEAGWIVESLTLQQPYHTPMFAPLMEPLREAFGQVDFRVSGVPIYSCATGQRFPDDAERIRQLSLAHWHNPVLFQSLIQQMYADGVRLFLEVGPRGNVSSFVGDILRGRPHAAIPMDTPRAPTADQIVHAAAQLAAHHVPVRLEALDPKHRQADRSHPQSAGQPGVASVMSSHLQTMHQMLAEQGEVMQQFLIGKSEGSPGSRGRRRRLVGRASDRRMSGPPPETTIEPSAVEAASSAMPLPQPNLPLLGEVVEYQAGEHLVMQRVLDPAIEHYATHHTVGGREISAICPQQCGLPVMPMTFTLEMMMEAAIQLAPDRVVSSISRVQLSRWLAFYDRDPITIRIEATLMPSDETEDATRVLVRVLDLGNRAEAFTEKPKLAAVGTVALTDHYPPAPAAEPLELTDPEQCTTTLKTMYNNLFHGELFQGVRSLARIGLQGIESTIEVLPRHELFNDDRPAEFLGDPVLLDVAMHPNAAWHLAQPNQTGRIMLPFEVKSVEFFGPRPDVGTTFQCHGSLDEQSPRHFTHSVETINRDGRVWNRINGVRLWRFYLPFHEVNFHGPKNVYHLSEEFAVPMSSVAAADLRTARVAWLDDMSQPTLLLAAAKVLLSDQEYETYFDMDVPHEAKVRWMFGRVVAKDAIRRLWHHRNGQRLYMADIDTRHDPHGKPIAAPRRRDHPSPDDVPPPDAVMPNISIAHHNKTSYAVAATAAMVGLAVQPIEAVQDDLAAASLTRGEIDLLGRTANERERSFAAILAAKKAVAKATGFGLPGDWKEVEIVSLDAHASAVARLAGDLQDHVQSASNHRFAIQLVTAEKLVIAVVANDP